MRPKASKAILGALLSALIAATWVLGPRISLAADEANKAWPPPVLPAAVEVAVEKADKLTVVRVGLGLPDLPRSSTC